jgi:beta-lactamase class A
MTLPMDRRSVLAGLALVAAPACSARTPDAAPGEQAARPAVAMAPIDLSPLEARNGGRIGLVALDTARGRSVGWRAQERFVYCSTFKMYLAAATLERIQRGEESLAREVPVLAADMVSHAPVTGPAVGSALSMETLCKAVVEVSDNPAANILIREYGGLEAWRGWYRSIGDDSTTVDRLEPEMNRLDGDKDTILPARSVANLQRLFVSDDTPLIAESRQRLLRWMIDSPTGAGRIKAGVPAGWTVAHKTGTGGYGPTNDIGLVYPPSGDPVVIAAYYHATPSSSAAANDAVIADATRLALEALGHG